MTRGSIQALKIQPTKWCHVIIFISPMRNPNLSSCTMADSHYSATTIHHEQQRSSHKPNCITVNPFTSPSLEQPLQQDAVHRQETITAAVNLIVAGESHPHERTCSSSIFASPLPREHTASQPCTVRVLSSLHASATTVSASTLELVTGLRKRRQPYWRCSLKSPSTIRTKLPNQMQRASRYHHECRS